MKKLFWLAIILTVFVSCNKNTSNNEDADLIIDEDVVSDSDAVAPTDCVFEETFKKNIIISPSANIWRYFLLKMEPKKLRFLVKEYGETVSEGDQWDPKGTRRMIKQHHFCKFGSNTATL